MPEVCCFYFFLKKKEDRVNNSWMLIPCIILEQIVKQSFCEHWEKNVLSGRNQHGFLEDMSCQTNLTSFFDTVISFIGPRNAMDTVYFDFSKAFDKVCHEILVQEVAKHGLVCATNWVDRRKSQPINVCPHIGLHSSFQAVEHIYKPVGWIITKCGYEICRWHKGQVGNVLDLEDSSGFRRIITSWNSAFKKQ